MGNNINKETKEIAGFEGMNIFLYFRKKREYLEKILVELKKRSYEQDNCLKTEKRNNFIQYVVYKKGNPQNLKYITKSNLSIAKSIAQRDYEKQVVKSIEEEIKCIERFFKTMPEITYEQVYDKLVEGRKKLVTPIAMTDEEYAKKWQEQTFVAKKLESGLVGYETQRGEIVRSKSEVIIADALYFAKIPYHYEKPLKVGNKVVHPDFTVLNVKNRKEYYWEHLGLLDDEDYLNKFLIKLDSYEKNGIRSGEKLILTKETKKHPLNTANVKEMIKYYLK